MATHKQPALALGSSVLQVRLLVRGNKDAARKLGIRRKSLYKWKAEVDAHGDEVFRGQGSRPSAEAKTTQALGKLAEPA